MSVQKSLETLQAQLPHNEIQQFVAFLQLKGLATTTLIQYLSVLRALIEHVGLAGRDPGQLSVADLRSCVAAWQSRGWQPSTVAGRVMVIKRFYGFLLAEGFIETDPSRRLPMPQLPKRLPRALTIEEMRRLLKGLSEATPTELRDKTLITLLYACGLRAGEGVSIGLEQLDLADGTLRVIGKGNKERRVFLKPQVVALLCRYLERCAPQDYLFPSHRGSHIGQGRLSQVLKRYVRLAGLPERISPHTLRHSCATHYLLGGAPITFVQGLLGHVNLRTTGQYTGLVDEIAHAIACETPLVIYVGQETPAQDVREPQAQYGFWGFDEAAWQVTTVLEWLSG